MTFARFPPIESVGAAQLSLACISPWAQHRTAAPHTCLPTHHDHSTPPGGQLLLNSPSTGEGAGPARLVPVSGPTRAPAAPRRCRDREVHSPGTPGGHGPWSPGPGQHDDRRPGPPSNPGPAGPSPGGAAPPSAARAIPSTGCRRAPAGRTGGRRLGHHRSTPEPRGRPVHAATLKECRLLADPKAGGFHEGGWCAVAPAVLLVASPLLCSERGERSAVGPPDGPARSATTRLARLWPAAMRHPWWRAA